MTPYIKPLIAHRQPIEKTISLLRNIDLVIRLGMRNFVYFFVISFSIISHAQDNALTQDPITRPALSIRCKELHTQRSEKIKNQQKLNGLLQRNQLLIKKTPTSREIAIAKLKATQIKIKNELNLTTLNIENLEETLIRAGCPGLAL